jgi:tetratricopeptide (TPR) repeat protein
MNMDTNNPIVKLCIEGSKAEFEGRKTDAFKIYLKAWEIKTNDYEACVAAHYIARFQETPEDVFFWNKKALDHAKAANDENINSFYPSLYLNMGRSLEALGNQEEANINYNLAIKAGKAISDSYGEMIEQAIKPKI